MDNSSILKLMQIKKYKNVTRHIEIKNLWKLDKCQEKKIFAVWIHMGTKPLDRVRLYSLMHLCGMRRLDNLQLQGNTQLSKINLISDSALIVKSAEMLSQP
jgi:hypothetical protein